MRELARGGAQWGFSLVELLVAVGLALVLGGAALGLVLSAEASALANPEAMDMQQRARAGIEALVRDLNAAGAGVDEGPLAGPLVRYFPPIVPRRIGLRNADPADTARVDTVTLIYVPGTRSQTIASEPLPSDGTELHLQELPNCPPGRPPCGFEDGMALALFNTLGDVGLYSVTATSADTAVLQLRGAGFTPSFPAGSVAAEVVMRTYYLDAAARQLRRYDGAVSDSPVVDNVVGLAVEYFGDPGPPPSPRPPPGYENCLYDVSGAARPLAFLTPDGGSLARLPLDLFTDGPWCGSGEGRFDADLLRIRKVRIRLRIQATPDAYRARGSMFASPGTSTSSRRYLPDFELTAAVAPRNLNLAR